MSGQFRALGAFLIAEPDPRTVEVLTRLCQRLRRVRVVDNVEDAWRIVDDGSSLTGVITEEHLVDGSGLELLKRLRTKYPLMPAVLLTGSTKPRLINRAARLRVDFIAKPAHRKDLRSFLRRTVTFERVPDQRIAWLVDDLVTVKKLSPRETDVLAAALQGLPRQRLSDQLGTTENTIKSCVKNLLRKCGQSNLDAMVREIMQRALDGSSSKMFEEIERESRPPTTGRFTIPPSARKSAAGNE